MAEPVRLAAAGIDVVLLDIEGTTTPIAFVHDVLFPYACARVHEFLATHTHDAGVQQIVERLCLERGAGPSSGDDIVPFVRQLIDRDVKSPALKALQGRIWEDGYASGELKGEVYPDVPAAFARWTAAGVRVAIFSSGSVLAQRLLFAHSTAGDLSPFIGGYFDTAVGAKGEPASYRRIVERLSTDAARVLFISDVERELDAARAAGFHTRLCVRPPALPPDGAHAAVSTFDAIV